MLMSKDFIFIKLMDANQNEEFIIEEEEMIEKSYDKLIKRISVKWYYKNLIKRLPMKLGKLTFLGDSIPCAMLPFTKEEKLSLPSQYLDQYIKEIMKHLNISRAYCMEELQEKDNERAERQRTLIKFLYLKQLVKISRDKLHIKEKDVKLVIIDSGDKRIEHVLELFVNNLNYLTIITNREEYFTGFRDMIYDTTGLVVEFEELPLKNHIEGNIIIDLDSESYKSYNFFPYGACVIDVNSSAKKRQYLQERRKDLTIIYDVDLLYQGNILKKNMMVNYLRAKSVNIEAIYGEYYRNINQNEILELIEACKVKIIVIVI